MKTRFTHIAALVVLSALASQAVAQQIEFKTLQQDSSLPVEVGADQLSVDQATGLAVFDGNVVVTQGAMTIKAGAARIENNPDGSGIAKLYFSGRVTFSSGTEAAEADEAVYTVADGKVVMTGDVLLTQGQTTIAGQELVYDLQKGTGQMQGRVQTTFVPKSGPKSGPESGTAP